MQIETDLLKGLSVERKYGKEMESGKKEKTTKAAEDYQDEKYREMY